MFFDCSALAMGLAASVIAKWKPTKKFSYGFGRVEGKGGNINILFPKKISRNFCKTKTFQEIFPKKNFSRNFSKKKLFKKFFQKNFSRNFLGNFKRNVFKKFFQKKIFSRNFLGNFKGKVFNNFFFKKLFKTFCQKIEIFEKIEKFFENFVIFQTKMYKSIV